MGPPEISLLPSERDVIGTQGRGHTPVAEMLRFPERYERATKTPAWAAVQARLV
jgi:hypothetical protein